MSTICAGQVTITNPGNTTPALAATYTSLANAITALNTITVISGSVTISLNPGFPQNAPLGGYAIQFAATTSAGNNIIFEGNNNTITASTLPSNGNLTDAIFKLIGADYITIQNFILQENASNTNTATAFNNMTEFGVALLRASTTDGAQNNTILNNTISLNKNYTNTFGIYSSVRHTAANISTDPITSITGSNYGNKVYGNTISNVNYGVVFIGSTTSAYMDNGNDIGGSSPATGNTFTNWGTAVSASSYPNLTLSNWCIFMVHGINENISYNTITSAVHASTNFLGGILKNFTVAEPTGSVTATYNNNTISLAKSATSGSVFGISIQGMTTPLSTSTININNNLISSIAVTGAGSSSSITGISNSSASGVLNMNNNTVRGCTSTGTTAGAGFTGIENTGAVVNNININNNKIGDAVNAAISYSMASTATIYGINNTKHPVTCNVSITNNDIRGILHSAGSSGIQQYITNAVSPPGSVGNLIISGNTFTSLSVNTTSSVYFIYRTGSMTATGSYQCINNSVVGSFTNNAAAASDMYFYYSPSNSQSVNGSAVNVTGNNFSNVTANGATPVWGSYDLEGLGAANGPSKNYTGNILNNISSGSGTIIGFYINNSGPVACSTNIVSNITSAGTIVAIWHGGTNGQGTHYVSNNTISNLGSSANNTVGILAGASGLPVLQVFNNSITNLTSGGASGQIVGIDVNQATSMLVFDNQISGLLGSGTTNPFAYGIRINAGTNAQVYRNNIQNLRQTGNMTTGGPAVIGLNCGNPTNLTAYNNFISDLRATQSGQSDAIRGIHVNALAANSNYNIYHNSVYIDAVSGGTNFGTSGIYHTGHATATTGRLQLINNIIVNTSTANGTGVSTAFRRSNANLANYAPASNYNLLYAGTPSTTKLIYYDGTNSDQTLGAFQATVSPRDANDLSLMPVFVSATDLHLDPANNCAIKGMGTFLAAVNADIDNDTRMAPNTDMGADEFNSTVFNNALAGIVGAAVCETKSVSVVGSSYSAQACNRIAYILPSGGTPITGSVTTCVTLHATPQYFNAEPYVQRHYDIEPVTSPATATATVTLYFTNQEFINYNSANPVWPALPVTAADPNRANVRITQFHGTPAGGLPTNTPANYSGSSELINPGLANVDWNVANSYWEVTIPVTGFSGFYAHSTIFNTPLPITINYITGQKQGSNHLLNWKVTCNSTPSATMNLERSSDGRNFIPVNSITADAVRCQQPFNYTDANPLKGLNYYRLKVADADGKITYSSTVALLNAVKGFDIISIAPNPVVGDQFKLNMASAQSGKMDLIIVDMQGRIMQRHAVFVATGFNSLPLNIASLASGSYIVSARFGDNQPKQVRFIKR